MSAIAMDISELTGKLKVLILSLKPDDEIIITADELPVARLTAVNRDDAARLQPTAMRRRAGTAEGTAWMSPDFNEPSEDFAEYMP
jgi:antitoxin (DNA-binding transcriptional repressor) of toxin-antitoxin stability system